MFRSWRHLGNKEAVDTMNVKQASKLMRIYIHLDANHSGGVTKRELYEAFKNSHSKLDKAYRSSISELDEAESYMEMIDGNHDGQVSAEEWMAFWESTGGGGS